MKKLKVLVLNQDVLFRKLIAEAVYATDMGIVVHFSSSSNLALEWLQDNEIDIVIVPIKVDEICCTELMSRIWQKNRKIEIIIVNDRSEESVSCSIEAIKMGAIDCIGEDDIKNEQIGHQLGILFEQIDMKKNMSNGNHVDLGREYIQHPNNLKSNLSLEYKTTEKPDLIIIASSTGGPVALDHLFSNINKNLSVPILVVQHMPPEFTKTLAVSIARKSGMNVIEGMDRMRIESNKVYIAPGGYHMVVNREKSISYLGIESTPFVNGVRPSVDVLYRSISKNCPNMKILTVVLTGMGNDGTAGIKELKEKCPTYTICQNEQSSVVFGMPKCVIEAGLSDEILDLKEIPRRICNLV